MRFIVKQGDGGYYLNQAHTTPPEMSQQATSRWSSFKHKPNVLRLLLHEQCHLCCYSEVRADQECFGYHIEHVENKSQNPQRTFDYSNLAACALNCDDLGQMDLRGVDAFGGHAPGKQNACDMQRFISPHRPDCHRFFAYLSDGRIVPAAGLNAVEQDQAQYTIDILNLDSPYLITQRRKWWAELDNFFQNHIANDLDLQHLAAIDLVPAAYKLSRFFSLTRQFFGQIAEKVLLEYAPELI